MSIRNYDPLNEQDRELPVGESLARKAAQCGDDSAKPALRWTAGEWTVSATFPDAARGHTFPPRVAIVGKADGVTIRLADIPDVPSPDSEEMANAVLMASAPELATALAELRKQLWAHVKLDVKKHFSLMVADAAAGKVLHKVGAP